MAEISAHLNPAVSLAFVVRRTMPLRQMLLYWVATWREEGRPRRLGYEEVMRLLRFVRLARLWRSFASALRLMRNPRVPARLKITAAVVALLILSPLNPLGDIPLVGMFDDAALLGLLAGWFIRAASRYDLEAPIEGELVPGR